MPPAARRPRSALRKLLDLPPEITDVFPNVSVLQDPADPRREASAAEMLRRVLSAVAPLARARAWTVPVVQEYHSADSTYGLNYNRGARITLKLREPSNFQSLLDFETCLHTMAHELVHIVVPNHSALFYENLEKLHEEASSHAFRLKHKIPTQNGPGRFWGKGQTLGPSGRAPGRRGTATSRRQARGPGHRVGGLGVPPGASLSEIIAKATMERLGMKDVASAASSAQAADDDNEDDQACDLTHSSQDARETAWICPYCEQSAEFSPETSCPSCCAWRCGSCRLYNLAAAAQCRACGSKSGGSTTTKKRESARKDEVSSAQASKRVLIVIDDDDEDEQ